MPERTAENDGFLDSFVVAHRLLMKRAAYGAMGLAFAAVVLTVGGKLSEGDQEDRSVNYISDSEYKDIGLLKALQYTPTELEFKPRYSHNKLSNPLETSIDYDANNVRELLINIETLCGRVGPLPERPNPRLRITTREPDCLNRLLMAQAQRSAQ